MNQRNSTIELSSSFQPEMMQGRVAGKSFKKIRYIQYCFLIRAVLMVKKYMHENLKHTVMKHLAKNSNNNKKKKQTNIRARKFQSITTSNSRHVSYFISNNTDTFMEYSQTILHTFLDIKQCIFRDLLLNNAKEFISSNTDIVKEFYPN